MAANRSFEFRHHDVWNYHFNPSAGPKVLPFPTSETFTLVIGHSIFTHLTEDQANHYLNEVCRVLADDGYFVTTWLLFDKADFPFMHDRQNALYVSTDDPGAAVIFDRTWLQTRVDDLGLVISEVVPPSLRGDSWTVVMTRPSPDIEPKPIPPDMAPVGTRELPFLPPNPDQIGLR